MLRALIFDFDGTIIDTEGPIFRAWTKTFNDMGCTLSFEEYTHLIGHHSKGDMLIAMLEQRSGDLGRAVHWETLDRARQAFYYPLVEQQPILGGVIDILQTARAAGIKTAVCSSSSRGWVAGHLQRRELPPSFDVVVGREDAALGKPHPDLYHEALKRLDVSANEAIAIEDSPNGTRAARAAGIFCVTVPNPSTAHMTFDACDMRVSSLSDISFEHLHRQLLLARDL